jgi:CHAD domain-containing protein
MKKAHVLRETLEREIKLSASPRFKLPALPGTPLPNQTFTSTYYDTPHYQLAQLGITFRCRVLKGKRLWQLKLPTGVARVELEIQGGLHPPTPFTDLLFALQRQHDLIPIIKIHTRRTGILVQGVEGPLAEVVLDRASGRDGKHTIWRSSEIEIELKGGDESTLSQLSQVLHDAGAQDGDPRPKAFQALNLEFSSPSPPKGPDISTIDHIGFILHQQVHNLLLHDPGTRFGKDIEELHQMRVSVRRLRAFLRTSRPLLAIDWVNTLRSELAWLGDVLGSVRDYDVLIHNLQNEISTLANEDRPFLERLLTKFDHQRSAARATMLEALRSPRYLKLLDTLDQVSPNPPLIVSDISLVDLAAKEFQKLCRMVKKLKAHSQDEDWHQLRIKVKRVRYATELVELILGKKATKFLRQIKKLQDSLGHHQDAAMTEQVLRKTLHNSRTIKVAFLIGQFVERLRTQRDFDRDRFTLDWRKVKKKGDETWPFSDS